LSTKICVKEQRKNRSILKPRFPSPELFSAVAKKQGGQIKALPAGVAGKSIYILAARPDKMFFHFN